MVMYLHYSVMHYSQLCNYGTVHNYIMLHYHNIITLTINMAAKCGMFMNCNKNLIGICKNQIRLTNKEYLRDHRCKRTKMA